MATNPPTPRIAGLDVIRGVAVMGILLANLPAFGLPEAAYFSPLAWGGSTGASLWAWFATFVLVEGKMRGLFSALFGASMLLVIDRANARGDDAAAVHFRRMAVLFAIGCLHLYLFWWGDILSHYALVGAFAYMAHRLPVRWLLIVAAALIALQTIQGATAGLAFAASAARDSPDRVATWTAYAAGFGVPPAAAIAHEIAAMRGGFAGGIAERWSNASGPLSLLPVIGPQTLSAMLLGMAGYRSGFLTGAWPRPRYHRWALGCLALAAPLYVALGANTLAHGFFPPWVFFASIVASEPLRPVMATGYAALIILATGSGGPLAARVAAVGRTAFTNYLGTTLLMTFVFDGWGLGRFGRWSRADLYLLAPPVWGLMLAWSQPWLARYRYGPLEWVWRSLARFAPQRMQVRDDATS